MIVIAEYDFIIRRGQDVSETFILRDSAGDPINLTGWDVYSQIRDEQHSGSDLIADFTVTIPDPTDGTIILSLTDTETRAITNEAGYYDILYVNDSAVDTYYIKGKITFTDGITVKP